jgi:single-strand DNA-binding protein
MPTFNQCQLIGRLGKDPDMSYTPNGKPVTKFSLAVDQGKDQETLWLNIVCWNDLAERMNQYLQKGMLVFVQGRLVVRPYTDKAQVKRVAVLTPVEANKKQPKNQQAIEETLALAGSWKALDFDDMLKQLHRIRHESKPTPPFTLDL